MQTNNKTSFNDWMEGSYVKKLKNFTFYVRFEKRKKMCFLF